MKPVKITYNWWPLKIFFWIGGITLGHRIYFKRNPGWYGPEILKHEMAHVAQIERVGFFKFYITYVLYSLRHGYHNNPYEVEARAAESLP
jgi:hypothetical protein